MAKRAAGRQAVDPEVTSWVEHLPEPFLICRDMGHSWRPYTAGYDGVARLYRRSLRCQRCKTERVQILDANGTISSSHYVYPDDYAAPKGHGHYDSAARAYVRLASVVHYIEKRESGAA